MRSSLNLNDEKDVITSPDECEEPVNIIHLSSSYGKKQNMLGTSPTQQKANNDLLSPNCSTPEKMK